MGTENLNNRIPEVDEGTDTYLWEHNRPLFGPAISVTHTKDAESVTIEFMGDELDVPTIQVLWLAEVLLQIADFYRVTYLGGGGDDYNRGDVEPGDRR